MPNSCDDNHAVWHFFWTFNNRNEAISMESSFSDGAESRFQSIKIFLRRGP